MNVLTGHAGGLCAAALLFSVTGAPAQTRVPYNHQQIFLNGSNIAWVNFAQDLGPSPIDTVAFRTAFDSIHAHGGNALRFWLHTTGQYTPQFNSSGMVTGPGVSAATDLRRVLDMAWQRKIGLILCLWSFDMMVIQNGPTVTGRSQLMLTDTAYTNAYIRNALIPLAAAVRAHPGIIAWEVFNEPEGMSNEFGWSTTYHVPMADIQRFVNLVAGAIHRTDTAARVTNGTWALIAGSDVTLLAKKPSVAEQLAALTPAGQRDMEDAFAARYGFRVSAVEILTKLAAANYNYYRDDRLIAAGGDPLGTLDFYTDHYYTWEGTILSPFHHPYSAWALTKPLVIAEFFPEQNLDIPVAALYDTLFANGYAGALSWGWYSGATGHPQATLQANTLMLTGELFARHPEEIDPDPVAGHIYSFGASPELIDSGFASTLTWQTARGTSAAIGGASVPIFGTMPVSPPVTTAYVLSTAGTIADTARTTVAVYPSGRIISFAASATSIGTGDPVVFRWRTSHGSRVTLNDSVVARNDSVTVYPPATTAYVLAAAGTAHDTSSIHVDVTPQDQLNRAFGKTMDVSESSSNPVYGNPQNMVDGDTATRWESPARNNEWIECYLGNTYRVTRVVIVWGPAYAASYRLRLSTDNSNWTTARTVTSGGGGTETLDGVDAPAGFVTLLLDTRTSDSSGFSVREFRVFGTLNPNGVRAGKDGLPDAFDLAQNYPNPFNPSTTITFALPLESDVTLTIHNALGQTVATLARGRMAAGYHAVTWRAPAASGVYFCRLSAAATGAPAARYQKTVKLLLLR